MGLRRERLTQTFLMSILRYEPTTGDFYKISGYKRNRQVGSVAVIGKKRYVLVSVTFGHRDSANYLAHQLAFLYAYGCIPKEIDHKDGNGLNNRIDNLRECSQSQNNQNAMRRSSKKSRGV